MRVFLSTPSARRATRRSGSQNQLRGYFYPRPPRGGRPTDSRCSMRSFRFLSTPSARRATEYLGTAPITIQFLSTPSARRATYTQEWFVKVLHEFLSTPSARRATSPPINWRVRIQISIHALREEGDPPGIELQAPRRGISIHALREEGDTGTKLTVQCLSEFLSTPSARRATLRSG